MLIVVVWHLTGLWQESQPLSGSTTEALRWGMASLRWSLALFFLMAGFFGAQLARRWGAKRFARDRLRRIGVPLGIGVLTVVPLSNLVLRATGIGGQLKGPGQLWFLLYVLLMYGGGLLVLRARGRKRVEQGLGELVSSPLAVPVLAGVTALALFGARQLVAISSEWLVPALLAFYGAFFFVGLLLHGAKGGIEAVGERMPLTGALALAALVPLVLLNGDSVWKGARLLDSPASRPGWLALYCLFTWASVFFVCGLGRRFLAAERAPVRYVADSSYWIYLMHYPLVPLVILAVAPLGLPFLLAWAAALALLFSVLLLAYELLVRHTIIGRTLNGPRPPRQWSKRLRLNRVPEEATR